MAIDQVFSSYIKFVYVAIILSMNAKTILLHFIHPDYLHIRTDMFTDFSHILFSPKRPVEVNVYYVRFLHLNIPGKKIYVKPIDCIRDLNKLNSIWGFDFKLEPILAVPQLPQKRLLDSKVVKSHLGSFTRVQSKSMKHWRTWSYLDR